MSAPPTLKGTALDAAAEAAYDAVRFNHTGVPFDLLSFGERERWRDAVRAVEHFVQYPEPENDA